MPSTSGKPSFFDNAVLFLATGGWIGFAPVAPGTFGSLAALPLCLLNAHLALPVAIAVTVAIVFMAVWISHHGARVVGRHDPKEVVIDEICGMAITMIGVPFEPFSILWGFILFRVFDITKPFPIRWVDKNVGGGWGIVMDDVMAGMLANAVMHLCILY
jgi:phosphatidylglycerophosphatase A